MEPTTPGAMKKTYLLKYALPLLVVSLFQLIMLLRYASGPTVQNQGKAMDVDMDMESNRGRVHVCIFTGRWRYLRILLPYLYRELRQNGGVVDKVLFAMLGYTEETQVKLKDFSETANDILNDEAFQLVYFKKDPITEKVKLGKFYDDFHYYVFQRLKENPLDVYFKIDDDIVYLRPNVFGTMLMKRIQAIASFTSPTSFLTGDATGFIKRLAFLTKK